ncbi:hypothetical protein [Paenibacillus tyrfis]|uniref:Uncharacterized protein n=1 Tax=Paenibacillus tyrfis TaxID=1501230 RepID=A0A081P3Z8_9BACL|nr:hypothetical protein [Paenibacillus tyrfis]KEQ25421.1 hypothetical protein ET33_01465 [Paenibacillus tyrfis]
MGTIGVITYLIVVLFILCYIKLCIEKTKRLAYRTVLKGLFDSDEFMWVDEKVPFIIIFLNYDSSNYGEIDALISKGGEKFIIVLQAPEWLFTLKGQIWRQHTLIDAKKLGQSLNIEGIFSRSRRGKIQYFSKPYDFLEYHNSRLNFLSKLDKFFSKK